MRRGAALVLALAVLAGCGDDDSSAPTTTVRKVVPTTARHLDQQLEAAIAAIYPGVPEGKATDWADDLCADIGSGINGDALEDRAARRFRGGDRPDPTPEQAAAIVEVVRPTCP